MSIYARCHHGNYLATVNDNLGFPPDAFRNVDYAFYDAENYAGRIGRDYAGIMLMGPVFGDYAGVC